jgi:hypothetical protein
MQYLGNQIFDLENHLQKYKLSSIYSLAEADSWQREIEEISIEKEIQEKRIEKIWKDGRSIFHSVKDSEALPSKWNPWYSDAEHTDIYVYEDRIYIVTTKYIPILEEYSVQEWTL